MWTTASGIYREFPFPSPASGMGRWEQLFSSPCCCCCFPPPPAEPNPNQPSSLWIFLTPKQWKKQQRQAGECWGVGEKGGRGGEGASEQQGEGMVGVSFALGTFKSPWWLTWHGLPILVVAKEAGSRGYHQPCSAGCCSFIPLWEILVLLQPQNYECTLCKQKCVSVALSDKKFGIIL